MDSKKFNKYKTVADIIEKSFVTLRQLSQPGANIYQLRKITDDYIIGELAKTYKNLSKGLTMPTCISVNNIICHYLPDKNEEPILHLMALSDCYNVAGGKLGHDCAFNRLKCNPGLCCGAVTDTVSRSCRSLVMLRLTSPSSKTTSIPR